MAEIHVIKDVERNLTIITVHGVTTAGEISRTIESHNRRDVTMLILWDLSQASFPAIAREEIREFAVRAKTFMQSRKGGKTAVVAPTDLGFGLARMYDILQETSQSDVAHMTFRDKKSALEWLLDGSPGVQG